MSAPRPEPTAPRLVATDIDGTLLHTDGTVSPRTAEVITRLVADGVQVTLVTGRPVRWLQAVYEQLDAPLPAVCANGAVVYEPAGQAILRTTPLLPDLLVEVARRLRDAVPDVTLAVEVDDGWRLRHESAWPLRREHDAGLELIAGPEELTSLPAVKLLARAAERDPDALVELVSGCLGGLAEATHSSKTGLVEISAAGVTKAAGLAWVCERAGVRADDVIAFGDMPNDVPMLTWVGRSVAVANAHPAVRDVADDVTHSNDEDGVAAYLEKVFEF